MLAGLQCDAVAEGATLVLLDRPGPYQQLAELVGAAERAQNKDSILRAERRRWTRRPGSPARDGVPVRAYAAQPAHLPGALAPRDFDLGRGWGQLETGGAPPNMTAVLTTRGDERADWLRAGQALHRLLVHAASRWVFASLHTQPLESAPLRAEIRQRLRLARCAADAAAIWPGGHNPADPPPAGRRDADRVLRRALEIPLVVCLTDHYRVFHRPWDARRTRPADSSSSSQRSSDCRPGRCPPPPASRAGG